MENYKELLEKAECTHNLAMAFLDKAEEEKRNGNIELSRQRKHDAYLAEVAAASMLPVTIQVEPSRSILYRSAASIALDLEYWDYAIKASEEGLMGLPPGWVLPELIDIKNQALLMKERNNEDRDKHTGSGR